MSTVWRGQAATGFILYEYSLGAKWLELLKELAPQMTRTAVIRDPTIPAGAGQFGAIQSVAPSIGVKLSPLSVREPSEIDNAVAAFARGSNGGLIVTGSPLATTHSNLIIALAVSGKEITFTFEFDPNELARVRNQETALFLYGHVDYIDVFDKNRSSQFSYQYLPVMKDGKDIGHQLIFQSEHNDAN
jgi:hypothetical protein